MSNSNSDEVPSGKARFETRFDRPTEVPVLDDSRFSRLQPAVATGPSGKKSQRIAPKYTGEPLVLKPHAGKKQVWLRPGGKEAKVPKKYVWSEKRQTRVKKVGIRKPYSIHGLFSVRNHFRQFLPDVKPIPGVFEQGLGDAFVQEMMDFLNRERQPEKPTEMKSAEEPKEIRPSAISGAETRDESEPSPPRLAIRPKPRQQDDNPITLFRKAIRSILNKVTLQNFPKLSRQLKAIFDAEVDSAEKLTVMVSLIFEKTIDEPKFGPLYCKLCQELSNANKAFSNDGDRKEFKDVLLDQCGENFNSTLTEFTNANTQGGDLERKKKAFIGTLKFIGELFKRRLLPYPIILQCLQSMLNSQGEWPLPDSIEFASVLLSTAGKELDKMTSLHTLNTYYNKLQQCMKDSSGRYPPRIKILVRNLIEERANGWPGSQDDKFGLVSVEEVRGGGKGSQSAFSGSILEGTGLSVDLSGGGMDSGLMPGGDVGGGFGMFAEDEQDIQRRVLAGASLDGLFGDIAPGLDAVPHMEMQPSMMIRTDIKAAAEREQRNAIRRGRRYGSAAANDDYYESRDFRPAPVSDSQTKLLSSFTTPDSFTATTDGLVRPSDASMGRTIEIAAQPSEMFGTDVSSVPTSARPVSVPVRASAAAPPPARAPSRKGQSGPALVMDGEEGEEFLEIFRDFMTGKNKDGDADLLTLLSKRSWDAVVLLTKTLKLSFDGSDLDRVTVSKLWGSLVGKRFVTVSDISKCMQQYFETYTDEKSDYPKIDVYISELIAPLLLDSRLDVKLDMVHSWITDAKSIDELQRPWKRRKTVTNQQKFVGSLLNELRTNLGKDENKVRQLVAGSSAFDLAQYSIDSSNQEWIETCETGWLFQ